MSPLHLRRYRAERLLRSQFESLRGGVLGSVRARLGASGSSLDAADLEACYSQAWQGLYAAVLEGEEIHNPAGWLVLVTHRRAIDEQRTRRHLTELRTEVLAVDRDLAAEVDDRIKLRRLLEGFGARLSERERQAAALCYLQGLTREEAAEHMGIGARRMQKLMEGRAGHPGVAAKVGALLESISAGRFCEEHASLMRALAFGVLAPEGERHRIALAHRSSCPSCRAYVLSLRGLSAALPPVFLPGLLGGAGLHGGAGAGGLRASRPEAGRLGARLSGTGVGGTKLVAAGAVVLGAGAAGVALTAPSRAHLHPNPSGAAVFGHAAPGSAPVAAKAHPPARKDTPRRRSTAHRPITPRTHATRAPAAALREFGIERPQATSQGIGSGRAPPAGGASQAEREFGIE
jgi:RNA polymerase sigma factor (sigma-70 family)